MALINLICENCAGHIELDNSQETGICKHCKSKVVIKSDTIVQNIEKLEKHVYGHEGKDVAELLADGNNLLEIGDVKKANAKFEQAIGVEPKCWEAWLGYAATGGDRSGYFSCVPAYRRAYDAALENDQELATFSSMVGYLPDATMAVALVNAYKAAPIPGRNEMFDRVLGVLGRDDSEIAALAIELCPDDWIAWFSLAKIRQLRVQYVELEGFFSKKLPASAKEVEEIFIRAYQLAKADSVEAMNTVLNHINTMSAEAKFNVFAEQLNARIRLEG